MSLVPVVVEQTSRGERSYDIFSRLLNDRIVFLADEVNDARTKLLGAQIARRVAAYRFVAAWAALNGIAGTMHEFESSANRSDNIFER